MNIGQAARESGLSARMIRHYEQIGLLAKAGRSDAGYRRYGPSELRTLAFIRGARDLGFSIDQIRTLLALWQDRGRASAEVKELAQAHIDALTAKAEALRAMAEALRHMAENCLGDDRPDCPILDTLAGRTACRPVDPHLQNRASDHSPTSTRVTAEQCGRSTIGTAQADLRHATKPRKG